MAASVQRTEWKPSYAETFRLSQAAVALLVLNLLDGLFTLTFLQLGVAEEVNPLMRAAYESSPLSFMVSKLAIVSTGLLLLCIHRHVGASQWAIRLGAAVYAGINIYHLAFVAHCIT